MDESSGGEGLRDRLTRQGEDTLGKLAQELLENPLVNGAITRAFEARERAGQAQEAALGALNIPSAADVERLTRRLRSVSQRLEGIEDGVDRLDERFGALTQAASRPGTGDESASRASADERLSGIESQLTRLVTEVAGLRASLPADVEPVPREQERLEVEAPATAKRARARSSGSGARRTTAKRSAPKKSPG